MFLAVGGDVFVAKRSKNPPVFSGKKEETSPSSSSKPPAGGALLDPELLQGSC